MDKIGNLSWVGPAYADKGWVELTDAEQGAIQKAKVMARVEVGKTAAKVALNNPAITVEEKIGWNDYLLALDAVCLCPDFIQNPKFPVRPDA